MRKKVSNPLSSAARRTSRASEGHKSSCEEEALNNMQNLEPHTLIQASPLFRNLPPHEIASTLACLQLVSVPGGALILERDAWHGQFYIIASGQVSVLLHDEQRASASADTLAVAHLGPGECFGEMSLLTGEPPSATVRAEQDTRLWAMHQADFLALLGTCPTLTRNMNTILSLRLARANRQIVLNRSAERIWLACLDAGRDGTHPERSLAPHVADALAARSQKRVLLLEICPLEAAAGPHFAVHAGQLRPSLLECAQDHSLFAAHRAPTVTSAGQHFTALASLAPGGQGLDEHDAVPGLPTHLADLAAFYDYLLLVTTQATPARLVRLIAQQSSRSVLLLPASMPEQAKQLIELAGKQEPPAIIVTHIPERPTIGAQDRYAAQLGQEVTRLLPANDALLATCWQRRRPLREVDDDTAGLTLGVDFVARCIARQTIGLAFGGGGARGFAHLGVLEQLVTHSVPIDYIAACSSGIIAPGMYLLGKSFAESEEIFLRIQRHIVRWHIPRTSMFSNSGLKRLLRELCGETRFEDLTTSFAMVAIDLSTRSGVVLDRGLLWQAGLASTALPGIFPPVLVGEHVLMDAGMHDPVPVRLVRKMGADILIASELGGQEPPGLVSATPWLEKTAAGMQEPKAQWHLRAPMIGDVLLRTYDLAMATIGMHSIREADIVIRPKLHRVSLRQFSEGRKFVVAGREAVEQSLPELQAFLPWVV
jgi:NTE family protein